MSLRIWPVFKCALIAQNTTAHLAFGAKEISNCARGAQFTYFQLRANGAIAHFSQLRTIAADKLVSR